MKDIRDLSTEEKEDLYKEKYPQLINIGRTHKLIRNVYNLNNNRKPNPNDFVVLESYEVIRKAIINGIKFDYFLVCPDEAYTIEAQNMVDELYNLVGKGYVISRKVLETIQEKKNSFGVIAVAVFPVLELKDIQLRDNMNIVILDGLEIQGNIGTIIRTCDGAGIDAVVLTNKRIRLSHPKFIKSSMGTALGVKIVVAEMYETIKWLESNNFTIYLTDTRAEKLYTGTKYAMRSALIAGSERYGIMKDWYDSSATEMIKIPMMGQADSLNVGVSTSIIIYEMIRDKIV